MKKIYNRDAVIDVLSKRIPELSISTLINAPDSFLYDRLAEQNYGVYNEIRAKGAVVNNELIRY